MENILMFFHTFFLVLRAKSLKLEIKKMYPILGIIVDTIREHVKKKLVLTTPLSAKNANLTKNIFFLKEPDVLRRYFPLGGSSS